LVTIVQLKINWVGLAGGSATIVAVVVSFFIPWWHLSAGIISEALTVDGLLQADVSPLTTNFKFLGKPFGVPLITALNIVGLLSFIASGVVMLIYSVLPTKPYSKHLLGFAYKKPLFTLVFFVVILVVIPLLVQAIAGINVPVSGSATVPIPEALIGGTTVSLLISTGFLWPFWLAVVASVLCIGARIYHGRFTVAEKRPEQKAPTETAAQPPAPAPAPEPAAPPEPTTPPPTAAPT
jgi:hypothetical protein